MSHHSHDTTPKAVDAEPKPGSSPAPIALIVFFALLVFWGMVYLDGHGGGFNPRVYQPYESFLILNDKQPKGSPDEEFIKKGEKVFKANCAVCHQDNGSGGANGCPPLAGSDWVNADGPNRIIRLVFSGGTGPITVAGKLYNPGVTMTPFGQSGAINDADLAAALSYVRHSWGNKASMVRPEQVKKVHDLGNHAYWTSADLLQIPDKD